MKKWTFRCMSLLAVLGLVLGGLSACGDTGGGNNGNGDGDGGGDLTLGPSGDTTVSELSDDEITTACDNYQSWSGDQVSTEQTCKFTGYFEAALAQPESDEDAQTACVEGRDACLDDPPEASDDCSIEQGAGDCDATVAELEACLQAQSEALVSFIDSFTCEELTLDDLEGGTGDAPQACQDIQDSCSSIVGGSTS